MAAAEAALLPPKRDPYWPRRTQRDPLELLRSAERLARAVPIDDETAGFSTVAVNIADLVRQVCS